MIKLSHTAAFVLIIVPLTLLANIIDPGERDGCTSRR